jgi:predicted small lipoprotein YifL
MGGAIVRRAAAVTCALLALAACGRVGELRPAPGQSLPVKPKLARTTPTAEQLLTPPPIARPERVDELQSRNEPRGSDRFDLPPPDGGSAPVAETNTQAERRLHDPGPATPQ